MREPISARGEVNSRLVTAMSASRTSGTVAKEAVTNNLAPRRVLLFTIVAVVSTCILEGDKRTSWSSLLSWSISYFDHDMLYPQQLVLIMLISYLSVDLAWYHPDFRDKPTTMKLQKKTNGSNIFKHSSSTNGVFSLLLKPPTVSIDVAEDIMTILFMIFIFFILKYLF